jgi:hypothetical protein
MNEFGNLPDQCALCRAQLGGATGNQVSSLLLCDPCHAGHVQGRIDHRGLQVQSKLVERQSGRPGVLPGFDTTGALWPGAGTGGVNLVGSFGRRLPLEAIFSPESNVGPLKKLFHREPQGGDPLFDRAIYIDARREPVLEGLIQSPGFQSAVLEIVADTGHLQIKGNAAATTCSSTDVQSLEIHKLQRDLAVVLHYLDRYSLHREDRQANPWP